MTFSQTLFSPNRFTLSNTHDLRKWPIFSFSMTWSACRTQRIHSVLRVLRSSSVWVAPLTGCLARTSLWSRLISLVAWCERVYLASWETNCIYRVSLKKGTFLVFVLVQCLEVGFYFSTCVSEPDFWARFIQPLKQYPFRILSSLKKTKTHAQTRF